MLVTPRGAGVDEQTRTYVPPAHQLLEDKAGAPVLEGGFWMDSIKTHCYATFDGKEAAERAMAALQDLQWPPQSFKRLEAKIGDMSAEEVSDTVAFFLIVFYRCCCFLSSADEIRKAFCLPPCVGARRWSAS